MSKSLAQLTGKRTSLEKPKYRLLSSRNPPPLLPPAVFSCPRGPNSFQSSPESTSTGPLWSVSFKGLSNATCSSTSSSQIYSQPDWIFFRSIFQLWFPQGFSLFSEKASHLPSPGSHQKKFHTILPPFETYSWGQTPLFEGVNISNSWGSWTRNWMQSLRWACPTGWLSSLEEQHGRKPSPTNM